VRISSLKINLFASWMAHAVGLVVGFFLMPYVLRILGDRSYGTWIFISSFAGYAGLMYLGFGATISRFVATYHSQKDWERLRQIFNVTLAIYSLMGLLVMLIAVALAAAAPWLHHWDGESVSQIRLVILILGLNVALGMTGSVFGGVLHGIQRFDLERGIAVLSDFVRVTVTILFLSNQYGLVTLAAIFLGITLLENSIAIAMVFQFVPELKIGRAWLKWGILKECLNFSAYALVGTVASQLMYATDSIVIGCLLGPQAIVPYYIARRLTDFLRKPILQIGDVCMPKAGQLATASRGGEQQRLIERSLMVALALSAGLFIGCWYFGDDLIRNWVGEKYADSHVLLLILFGAQVIALPLGVLRSILFGMGNVRAPSLMFLGEAIANLVLSLILIQIWGPTGVAIATAVPIFLVELFVLLPYVIRNLKLDAWHLAKATIGPVLLPMAALWLYSAEVSRQVHQIDGWAALFAVAAGGGAVLLGTAAVEWFLLKRSQTSRPAVAGAS
jgi:O-antigen/teichoic acid export membrane protein